MKQEVDIVNGKVLKALIIFSIPFLLSNLFQQLYNTIDTYIVGNTLNESSVAAIGACAAVYELLVGFALGVGNGLSIVIARFYGADDEKNVRKSIGASFVISIIISGIIMLIAVFLLYPLLELLNTPKSIIDEAFSYIFVITIFVAVMMAFNLFSAILKAMGNSLLPLIFLVIASVLNVILDYEFIANLSMGIRGAAVATVIAQFVAAVMSGIYMFVKYKRFMPKVEDYKIDKELYREMWGQGLSMGFMNSIVSLGTVVLQYAINGLNIMIITGHTAARKIFSFSMLPITTAGLSVTTFVSQNKGARKPDRIRKSVRYLCIITVIWSLMAAVILWLSARNLIGLISGSDNKMVLDNGENYLKFNSLFYIPLSILVVLRCALQGFGKKILPLVSSVMELVGKIIFSFICIPILKYSGVIICEPVIWVAMMLQLIWAYYYVIKNDEIFKKEV